uniref:Immunoglobulin V-set domain-containing protein n=1 Tax=Callithrix jacchus TaxID=9483 RepID=A0A2R8PL26_CALJA
DTKVTQRPRYVVTAKEQKAKMDCVPIKGHSYVYWYHKKLEEELKFLVYLQNGEIIQKSEVINERFLAQCPENSPCALEIQSTESKDEGLYFCASSEATVSNVSPS